MLASKNVNNQWTERLNNSLGSIFKGLLVAAVLIVAGIGFYQWQKDRHVKKEQAAFVDFYAIENFEEDLLKKQDEALKKAEESKAADAKNKDPKKVESLPTKKSVEELLKGLGGEEERAYLQLLEKAVKSESPTVQALAQLKKARFYLHRSDSESVMKSYQAVESLGLTDEKILYKAIALLSQAKLYEEKNDLASALAYYAKLEKLENSPFKQEAFMGQARVLGAQGKKDDAKNFYDKVIKEDAESSSAKKAKVYKALLDSEG